jgi:hypothetical protein
MTDCFMTSRSTFLSQLLCSFTPVSHASPASFSIRNNKLLKHCLATVVCLLVLLSVCPCALADTHFGISLDTGDQKVSWVGEGERAAEDRVGRMNLTVSDNQTVEKADRWNPEYETDIDYGAYIKSFKLFLVIKKAF